MQPTGTSAGSVSTRASRASPGRPVHRRRSSADRHRSSSCTARGPADRCASGSPRSTRSTGRPATAPAGRPPCGCRRTPRPTTWRARRWSATAVPGPASPRPWRSRWSPTASSSRARTVSCCATRPGRRSSSRPRPTTSTRPLPLHGDADALRAQAAATASTAAARGASALRDEHVADHARLFDRVALDLGETPAAELPTDERLRRHAAGEPDPGLAALAFHLRAVPADRRVTARDAADDPAGDLERRGAAAVVVATTRSTSTPR